MPKFKHTLLLSILLTALALTGCMSSGNQPEATPTPMPQATLDMGTTAPTAAPAYDWQANANKVEANISQISEISECRVVTSDDTALVGVKFTSAYRGELTERIREMIAAIIMAADPAITTIAVTAEQADVEDVYDIADKLATGADAEVQKPDIDRIVRNTTTLR